MEEFEQEFAEVAGVCEGCGAPEIAAFMRPSGEGDKVLADETVALCRACVVANLAPVVLVAVARFDKRLSEQCGDAQVAALITAQTVKRIEEGALSGQVLFAEVEIPREVIEGAREFLSGMGHLPPKQVEGGGDTRRDLGYL